MTPDDSRTSTVGAVDRPDPDEYVPTGDADWSEAGVGDPEEVASGDRRPGGFEESGGVPSGESEQDLSAEDLGAEPAEVDEDLGDLEGPPEW